MRSKLVRYHINKNPALGLSFSQITGEISNTVSNISAGIKNTVGDLKSNPNVQTALNTAKTVSSFIPRTGTTTTSTAPRPPAPTTSKPMDTTTIVLLAAMGLGLVYAIKKSKES